jgi:hypothetical protein
MQPGSSRGPSSALIGGIAGGVVIVIGSLLTWGTVALDVNGFIGRLADALGIDPDQIPVPAGAFGAASRSVSGIDTSDGKITLVAGIVVVVASLLLLSQVPRKLMAGLMILGGAVGAGVALYDISQKDELVTSALGAVKDLAGPQLQQLGLDASILDTVFKVSLGVGLWICMIGGVIAIVAGLMALMSRPTPVAGTAGAGEATSGVGAPVDPMPAPMPAAPVEAPHRTTSSRGPMPPGEPPQPPA